MKRLYRIFLATLLYTNLLFPQSSAIIFCVDGLNPANTLLNINMKNEMFNK